MTTKVIRRAQLIKGGDIIKQGETFTLGFRLFDANDRIIQLESADVVTVKIANRTGIIKEVTASKVDDTIEFTVNESIGHGEMRVELTVTNGSNVQKYPAREWIRLLITQSLDDAGAGGIQAITAQQMFSRIDGAETKATTAETKATAAETTANDVKRDFDQILAEAGDSNPEIVAARLGEDNLRVFNEKTIAQLADKAAQAELEVVNQRIESLIELPEGSTSNDARLEDIKIGADGTVYPSPGDATRAMGSKVHVGETQNSRSLVWINTSETVSEFASTASRLAYLRGIGTNSLWSDGSFNLALTNFTNAFEGGSLDLTGDVIQYGSSTDLVVGADMTYVIDVTTELVVSGTRRLLSLRAGGNTLEIASNTNGGLISTPPFSVNAADINNKRVVVVLVVSGNTRTYYVNGVEVGTLTDSSAYPIGAATLTIGNADNAKMIERQYAGEIHNILFYNRILSTSEIADLSDKLINPPAIQSVSKLRIRNSQQEGFGDFLFSADDVVYGNGSLPLTLNDLQERLATLESGGVALKKKLMHLSVDDVILTFKELTESTYTSLFEHPVLAFFKQMNDQYGAVFSLYAFYTDLTNGVETFNLSQMTDRFKAEFEANSDWLKIGFHAREVTSSYGGGGSVNAGIHYNEVINQVIRFAGKKSIDKVVRLGFYAGNIDAVTRLKAAPYGIIGLLSAEDTRNSYYHTEEQRLFLQANDELYDDVNNVYFASTDLRLENSSLPTVASITTELNNRLTDPVYADRMEKLIIFTHEVRLTNQTVLEKIEASCQFASENGYIGEFPMSHINTSVTL